MSTTATLMLAGVTWLAIGAALSAIMGRRGHDPFVWWLLGTVLGPLAIILALVPTDRRRPAVAPRHGGPRVRGRVDVLVGLDGSTHAAGALQAMLGLLGDRLGRVTLATVLPRDDSAQRRLDRSAARERLEDVAATIVRAGSGPRPRIALLSGRPADELERFAIEEGYDLLVVGARGVGLSTALLGSTATTLAARGRVPVLVAGGEEPTRRAHPRQRAGSVTRDGELLEGRGP
jgi:nucleotide-binding universal stress UspA family protein